MEVLFCRLYSCNRCTMAGRHYIPLIFVLRIFVPPNHKLNRYRASSNSHSAVQNGRNRVFRQRFVFEIRF